MLYLYMSLLGYINNGLNQSLNGIVTITDGNGTTISDGVISSNTMSVNTFNATNLSTNNMTVYGTLTLPNGSILDVYLTSNVPLKNNNNTFTGINEFISLNMVSGTYQGFLDSTNLIGTYIGQGGNDFNITNYGSGSIIITSPIADLTNTYTTLKGGTYLTGYNTHFPYTDGKNYITGITNLRGGAVNITDGLLSCSNSISVSNTLQFTNSTSVQQILLYQLNATYPSYNYTISIENDTLRYNIGSGSAPRHLFSRGTGLNVYSNIALLDSLGITIANGDLLFTNAGHIVNTTGNILTLPITTDTFVCKNTTDTLTNKTLTTPIISQIKPTSLLTLTLPAITDTLIGKATTDILTNKTISNGNFTNTSSYNNGAVISQYDIGNSTNTTLFQSGGEYFMYNTNPSSVINLRTQDATTNIRDFKISYNSVLCSTDFYVQQSRVLVVQDNYTTISQTNINQSSGNFYIQNLANPNVSGGHIYFNVYNTLATPTLNTILELYSEGVSVLQKPFRVYNTGNLQYLQLEQNLLNSYISNFATSGSLILRTYNGTSNIENIEMTPTSTIVKTPLICNKNITLQSSFTTPTAGQLGYTITGSPYYPIVFPPFLPPSAFPVVLTSGSVNQLASIGISTGIWNFVGQFYYNVGTGGTITSEQYSISTSATTLDSNNLLTFGTNTSTSGFNIVRRMNTIITNTTAFDVQYYLTMYLTFSSGSYQWLYANQATYAKIYAVRIA